MESIFLYVFKASGLLAAFYLAYYVGLRKETFFTSNRWYLLAGLITSLILPLITYTKTVWITPSPETHYSYDSIPVTPVQASVSLDWYLIVTVLYGLVALGLLAKILVSLLSLGKFLYSKERVKKGAFSLITLEDNQAPFSFFNYIAINPNLYTERELESILLHEKVHSREKHALDVLLVNIYCVLFWFNPFAWSYKKAILQNLEYIADQKAIRHLEDKKAYQRALLKVVAHQNNLSITNHFYQSLIKKRIVMLNTHQSPRGNSLKYLVLLPILLGFFIFFQVNVIAQEKLSLTDLNASLNRLEVRLEVDKNTTDAKMKKEKERFKQKLDTDLKFSKIKRNNKGELTAVKVDIKTRKGKSETYQFSGNEPIKPFVIYASKDANGVVNVGYRPSAVQRGFLHTPGKAMVVHQNSDDFEISFDFPETPEAPEIPDGIQVPEPPEPPYPHLRLSDKSIIIRKDKNGKGKTKIILNGEVVTDSDKILAEIESDLAKNLHFSFNWEDSEDGAHTPEKIKKIRMDAIGKAKIELERLKPELEKSKIQITRSFNAMEQSRKDMEQSKKEIEQARQEVLQAKAELEQARKELEQAKAALKKQ